MIIELKEITLKMGEEFKSVSYPEDGVYFVTASPNNKDQSATTSIVMVENGGIALGGISRKTIESQYAPKPETVEVEKEVVIKEIGGITEATLLEAMRIAAGTKK